MKLLGKQAGHILWEILGPVDGRNRWSDGINAVAVVPSTELYLSAPALTAIEIYENVTPVTLTGNTYGPVTQPKHDRLNPTPGNTETATSPRPITFGEGQRPDPYGWALKVTVTSAGVPISAPYAPTIGTVLVPTWLRVVLKTPIPVGVNVEGYVRYATQWS